MPAQPHLFALDIDGTLLVTGQLPSRAVIESIRRAQEAGHQLVLATGRSVPNAARAAKQLNILDGWMVASNGAVTAKIADGSYTVTETHSVNARAVVDLVSAVRPDLCMATEILEVGYHVWGDIPIDELSGSQVVVSQPQDLWVDPTPRLVIYGKDARDLVPPIRAGGMNAVATRPDWIDVTPGQVTKATALEALRRQFLIPKERTVAIGDSDNDIPMLRWAERGVAMGHAPDNVRSHAAYRTKSVLDDGAALILNEYTRSGTRARVSDSVGTH